MPHKPTYEETAKVHDAFKLKDIWTQKDLVEMLQLPQSIISTCLKSLEEQGKIVWIRSEAIRQVKFYEKVN